MTTVDCEQIAEVMKTAYKFIMVYGWKPSGESATWVTERQAEKTPQDETSSKPSFFYFGF